MAKKLFCLNKTKRPKRLRVHHLLVGCALRPNLKTDYRDRGEAVKEKTAKLLSCAVESLRSCAKLPVCPSMTVSSTLHGSVDMTYTS